MGAAVQSYTTGFLAPFEPYFYGIVIMMFLTAIYMKTENLTMVGTLGFIISATVISGGTVFDFVPAGAIPAGFFVLTVSVFIVVFKLFRK